MLAEPRPDYEELSDQRLAQLAAMNDAEAAAVITRRNNRRLYRAAWSILRNHADSEDAVQAAYLNAFRAMSRFDGRSSLSTWLTKIVVNEALGRRRERQRWWSQIGSDCVARLDLYRERLMRGSVNWSHPDANLAREQIRMLLEKAIARLPEKFRIVFVLREIEDMSIQEVAETLQIAAATVKTRHLRARVKLQEELSSDLKCILSETLPFAGQRCAAVTQRVLNALEAHQQRP